MRVAITGASGFVGKHLTEMFKERGDEVLSIGRAELKLSSKDIANILAGSEVVINLAGSPIVGRWSEKYKKILRSSRIDTTHKLVEAISQMETKPKHLISTSAVGIYNNRETHGEESTNYSDGFLSTLCRDWEGEAKEVEKFGVNLAIFRFGIVLGRDGGALQKMLLPFKLGVGGKIGSGKQGVSFIHIEDLKSAYTFVIERGLSGVFNLGSPQPTTNLEMTKALGKALHRPTISPLPEFVVKLIFSEGARVLIDGEKMVPNRLVSEGFQFKFPDISSALENIVK
jgi:uncharacterized protein (TIGR01777 family)